eukprot:TRINITY_DN3774_c0_g1_i2.p1 TRINITY_DN3774_c0_g1~~TRINITY_DN3774_c0_g1_i2.p1  ORF type:complete len:937 (+),score=257.58 TRINITY_DN3774_c0_g1_i2:348-3158(+)
MRLTVFAATKLYHPLPVHFNDSEIENQLLVAHENCLQAQTELASEQYELPVLAASLTTLLGATHYLYYSARANTQDLLALAKEIGMTSLQLIQSFKIDDPMLFSSQLESNQSLLLSQLTTLGEALDNAVVSRPRGPTEVGANNRITAITAFSSTTLCLGQSKQLSVPVVSNRSSAKYDKHRHYHIVEKAKESASSLTVMITRNQFSNYEQLPIAALAFSELLSIVDSTTDSGAALRSVLVKVSMKYLFFLNETMNHKKTETPSPALIATASALKEELKKMQYFLEEYEDASGLKSGADLQEAIKAMRELLFKMNSWNVTPVGNPSLVCDRTMELKQDSVAFVATVASKTLPPKDLSNSVMSLVTKLQTSLTEMNQEEIGVTVNNAKQLVNSCLSFLLATRDGDIINSTSSVNLPLSGEKLVDSTDQILSDRLRALDPSVIKLQQALQAVTESKDIGLSNQQLQDHATKTVSSVTQAVEMLERGYVDIEDIANRFAETLSDAIAVYPKLEPGLQKTIRLVGEEAINFVINMKKSIDEEQEEVENSQRTLVALAEELRDALKLIEFSPKSEATEERPALTRMGSSAWVAARSSKVKSTVGSAVASQSALNSQHTSTMSPPLPQPPTRVVPSSRNTTPLVHSSSSRNSVQPLVEAIDKAKFLLQDSIEKEKTQGKVPLSVRELTAKVEESINLLLTSLTTAEPAYFLQMGTAMSNLILATSALVNKLHRKTMTLSGSMNVLKSGVLEKCSQRKSGIKKMQQITSWKKRMFVLKPSALEYSTVNADSDSMEMDIAQPGCGPAKPKRAGGKLKGIIALSRSTTITRSRKKHKDKYFVLQLQSPGSRKKFYFLYHQNEEELQTWFTAISNAIDALSQQTSISTAPPETNKLGVALEAAIAEAFKFLNNAKNAVIENRPIQETEFNDEVTKFQHALREVCPIT